MLSLSKHERTLKVINTLFKPDSFFGSFFNPCSSATYISVRAELVEVGTDAQGHKYSFQP
ncbi:MAG: hypothetical protein LBD67_00580 [Candidatus Accumulibacter sp.]|nr:hypothetical protein [Accumulibacter sp.]